MSGTKKGMKTLARIHPRLILSPITCSGPHLPEPRLSIREPWQVFRYDVDLARVISLSECVGRAEFGLPNYDRPAWLKDELMELDVHLMQVELEGAVHFLAGRTALDRMREHLGIGRLADSRSALDVVFASVEGTPEDWLHPQSIVLGNLRRARGVVG